MPVEQLAPMERAHMLPNSLPTQFQAMQPLPSFPAGSGADSCSDPVQSIVDASLCASSM